MALELSKGGLTVIAYGKKTKYWIVIHDNTGAPIRAKGEGGWTRATRANAIKFRDYLLGAPWDWNECTQEFHPSWCGDANSYAAEFRFTDYRMKSKS